jgi:hypothetical protein
MKTPKTLRESPESGLAEPTTRRGRRWHGVVLVALAAGLVSSACEADEDKDNPASGGVGTGGTESSGGTTDRGGAGGGAGGAPSSNGGSAGGSASPGAGGAGGSELGNEDGGMGGTTDGGRNSLECWDATAGAGATRDSNAGGAGAVDRCAEAACTMVIEQGGADEAHFACVGCSTGLFLCTCDCHARAENCGLDCDAFSRCLSDCVSFLC